MLKCTDCKQSFTRRSNKGPKPKFCDDCRLARRRARDVRAHRTHRNTDEYRAKYRAYTLKKNYGITVEQYDAMFIQQGKCCAICRRGDTGWTRGWHVDHCHESGRVRGILCHKCNLMVGLSDDKANTLRRAAKYLDDQVGWVAPNIADIIWKENDGRPAAPAAAQ